MNRPKFPIMCSKLYLSQEYFCKKYDHSLFTFGFSSKKRPNSLVIGRTFDYQVLDMFELAIVDYKPMEDFKVSSSNIIFLILKAIFE